MSRRAVSPEHLTRLAYFEVESLPSNSSQSRLITLRWRSLHRTDAPVDT